MKILFFTALLWGNLFFSQTAQADVCDAPGNLVVNCGFESGDLTAWTLQSPSSEAGNWYGVDTFDAETGNYGAYLGGFGSYIAGSKNFAIIGQRVPTVIGKQYFVTYDWAHDTSSNPTAVPDNLFFVGVNGFVASGTEKINVASQAFTLSRYTFTATTLATLIGFEAEDANSYFSLDNVYLAAVPEPANLVCAGLAFFGLPIFWLWRKARP